MTHGCKNSPKKNHAPDQQERGIRVEPDVFYLVKSMMPQKQKKIQGKFYPLTPEMGQRPKEAKPSLTIAPLNIWAYMNPDDRKRIHLFAENLNKLSDIESACLPFNINVTGEEV